MKHDFPISIIVTELRNTINNRNSVRLDGFSVFFYTLKCNIRWCLHLFSTDVLHLDLILCIFFLSFFYWMKWVEVSFYSDWNNSFASGWNLSCHHTFLSSKRVVDVHSAPPRRLWPPCFFISTCQIHIFFRTVKIYRSKRGEKKQQQQT